MSSKIVKFPELNYGVWCFSLADNVFGKRNFKGRLFTLRGVNKNLFFGRFFIPTAIFWKTIPKFYEIIIARVAVIFLVNKKFMICWNEDVKEKEKKPFGECQQDGSVLWKGMKWNGGAVAVSGLQPWEDSELQRRNKAWNYSVHVQETAQQCFTKYARIGDVLEST